MAGSLLTDVILRDGLWVIGISGLTGSAILLIRTVAQVLHDTTERQQ